VTFNGTAATSFTVNSETQLRATVPTGATSGKIRVVNSAGAGASANNFVITSAPVVTSFTPASGPVGTEVTITGANFNAITGVTFNGTAATNFTRDTATQIRATVPAGATTGKITVTNSAGNGTSADNFNVMAITSFTPANGPVGAEVTITGVHFTGITAVKFNGTPAGFTVDSETQIRATVSAGTNTGKIAVTNAVGTALSASNFVVTSIPVVTSFAPNNGPAGSRVTITGSNFGAVTSVTFNGVAATDFTRDSATQIRATVPAGATTGKIGVTNSAGTGLSANDFIVTFLPVITSFSPADGPVSTEVTIVGSNFVSIIGVNFNGTAVTGFTVDSNTQIRANVPAGASTGKIGISNSAGTGLSANDFIVTQPPSITSFTPTFGQEGMEVTITGNNFAGVNVVAFNGTAATNFTIVSNTQIRATVPIGATTGKISVTNSAGAGLSGAVFTVKPPPMISSFTPTTGPVGTEVTIAGNNFSTTTAVAFNGTAATFTIDSNTQLRATVPAGASTGKISVTADGIAVSANDFVVTAMPAITSFIPANGPTGTQVTLTGANFMAATSVTFNGTPAADFTVDSNTQLRATVPAGATTGKIAVVNSAGTGQSATNFIVTSVPAITSFTPGNGPVGIEVTLTGANFNAITSVTFNGVAATNFTPDSAAQLRATVPAGATTGKIAVTNSAGTGMSATDFIVTALTSFTPNNGPVGTQVTLTGTNFTSVTSVTFNGTPATTFTIDSDTQIRATVPAGATTGKIGVTNASGTDLSATNFIVTLVPTITSFTPNAGPYGTAVTITGTHFVVITNVTFNGTAASFTVDSDTQIRATVPEGAASGKIGVTNSAGTGLSASNFNVPAITSFTPSSGPFGTEVTLTGAHFTGATSVTFNGTAAASFTVDSDTQLRAVVPTGSTPGKIAVTTPIGTALSLTDFTVTLSPTIASFTPTIGPEGMEVTIVGNNFFGTSVVAFNGTAAASFIIDSNTQIRAIVPVGATTGKISITNSAGGGISGGIFTVKPPPTISSFTPANGPVGRRVTITGTNFVNVTNVTFNGVTATNITVDSNTQIRANVPTGATTGKISVITPDGTALSANDFIVTFVPEVTSFAPASGTFGTQVTVIGANFVAINRVTFNGTVATNFTVDSPTQIRATVPAGATTGKIGVRNSAGTGLSVNDFTVIAITSFAPNNGPVGTEVTLTGANFTGATSVTFNGTAASSFIIDSDTQIRAIVPAGATSGKILVINATGTGSSANEFIVTALPAITSFTPNNGPHGTEVTITGANFTAITGLTFNGTAAAFMVDSPTQIRATVPVGASTGKIAVTNSAGTGLSASDFTVTFLPTITSFSPTTGPVGTEVTINGNNFTGVTAVTFNGTAATFTIDSNTRIRTIVPAGVPQGGSKIMLFNSAGTGATATDFLVTQPPAITSFTPITGPFGAEVTIMGSGFIGTSGVAFNGTPATIFTVDSNTQLRANVPVGATTGKISITNSAGTGLSGGVFTVKQPPTISSFTPTNGPVGRRVTITGSNFVEVIDVAFNGVTAANITMDSPTQIRANVPAGATTGKISVTTSGGTRFSANDFIVTVVPVVTSFTPNNGSVGTEVTLTGNSFVAINRVTFSGTPATSFTVDSETQIRATVPAGATTGKIGVRNSAGTGLSANDFIVTNMPVITSFTPSNGPVGTEVTITGTNLTAITTVTFNGAVAANFIVDSSTRIRAMVPAGATTGKIGVTNSAGTGSSADDFIVTGIPTITSFTPIDGPVGTEVTIVGSNFTGLTAVTFNGIAAIGFTLDSDTQIRVTVPTGATTGKLGVTNSAGSTLSASDFTVTIPPAVFTFTPIHDSYVRLATPTNGFGTSSTLRQRLADSDALNTYLKFNVTGLTGPVQSATLRLYVTLASDDGGSVYVVSNNYEGTTSPWTENGLKWNNAPLITGTPLSSAGPVNVDTWVELEVTAAIAGDGTYSFGLKNTSTNTVFYSSKEGANLPELIIHTGSASVSGPSITSFAPTIGVVGTEVTITGNHFTGATAVTFNSTPATTFAVDSDMQIRANVPTGVPQGGIKIGVTTPVGNTLSTTDFIVSAPPSPLTFAPLYDTYVRSAAPTNNYGSVTTLRQRAASSDVIYTYLKFNVTGLSGLVLSAKLRLYVTDASDDGGAVYLVSNDYEGTTTPWTENGLKWNNAPVIGGSPLSSAGPVSATSWVELEVTAAITGNGIYSFALKNTSADAVLYSSKEETSNIPELVIQPAPSALATLPRTVAEEITTLPEQFHLFPNYPNPFNAHTAIEYALPQEAHVRLVIYDALGHLVRTLVDQFQPAGHKRVVWNGRNDAGMKVGSGIYLYKLEAGGYKLTRKMTLQQ
jgi:hypothetical protein